MFPFLVFYVACRFLNFPADKSKSLNMSALKFYSSSLKTVFCSSPMNRRFIVGERVYFFLWPSYPCPVRSADWNRRLFFHVFSSPLSPSPVIRCSTFDLTKIAFESLHQNLMAWKRTGRDGFVRKKQNSHFDHFPLFHPGLKKLHKKNSGSFPHAIFTCLLF